MPLELAGNFDANRVYLVKGATLKAWQEALKKNQIICGSGITETGTPLGRVISAAAGVGVSELKPFQLIPGEEANEIDVLESSIGSEIPSGFAEGRKTFVASGTGGYIYARVAVSNSGEISSVGLLSGSSVPNDTNTVYHAPIGWYAVEGTAPNITVTMGNLRYGPVNVTICRDWFASSSPYYGVSLS